MYRRICADADSGSGANPEHGPHYRPQSTRRHTPHDDLRLAAARIRAHASAWGVVEDASQFGVANVDTSAWGVIHTERSTPSDEQRSGGRYRDDSQRHVTDAHGGHDGRRDRARDVGGVPRDPASSHSAAPGPYLDRLDAKRDGSRLCQDAAHITHPMPDSPLEIPSGEAPSRKFPARASCAAAALPAASSAPPAAGGGEGAPSGFNTARGPVDYGGDYARAARVLPASSEGLTCAPPAQASVMQIAAAGRAAAGAGSEAELDEVRRCLGVALAENDRLGAALHLARAAARLSEQHRWECAAMAAAADEGAEPLATVARGAPAGRGTLAEVKKWMDIALSHEAEAMQSLTEVRRLQRELVELRSSDRKPVAEPRGVCSRCEAELSSELHVSESSCDGTDDRESSVRAAQAQHENAKLRKQVAYLQGLIEQLAGGRICSAQRPV